MSNLDIAYLNQWLGNEAVATAAISAEIADRMAATLDRDWSFQPGDPLPPAWHWLYFHEAVKTSALGREGHPRSGGLLPPAPLPGRMWAGGRLNFARPLHIGDQAVRRSRVKAITPKSGRSGQLCFVVVGHEISVEGHPCLSEEQTIVYRELARGGQPAPVQPAPTGAELSRVYTPDPVLLFRYSALTFNSHRIHYDLDYCRQVEGYPDLVVHGPLLATLLLDLVTSHYPDDRIGDFIYQARSPLFNPDPFSVNGRREGQTVHLWAANKAGGLAMQATVTFATEALTTAN
jgi:3-methylfumaryl-CoA hydratase